MPRIFFKREPASDEASRSVRRFLAECLLPSAEKPPPMAAWKAWLLAAWMLIVAAVYLTTMLGLKPGW
jgi:hypothetical protein